MPLPHHGFSARKCIRCESTRPPSVCNRELRSTLWVNAQKSPFTPDFGPRERESQPVPLIVSRARRSSPGDGSGDGVRAKARRNVTIRSLWPGLGAHRDRGGEPGPRRCARKCRPTLAPYPSRHARTATIKVSYQYDSILIDDRVTNTTLRRGHPDERTQRQHRCEGPARVVAISLATRMQRWISPWKYRHFRVSGSRVLPLAASSSASASFCSRSARRARSGLHRPKIRRYWPSLGPRLVRNVSDHQRRTCSSATRRND